MNPWAKRALIALPVLVVLFFAAIFIYANVINDPPDALTSADLSEAIAGTDTTTAAGPTSNASTSTAQEDTTASTEATAPAVASTTGGAEAAPFHGTWSVTPESEFGYRVEEILFGVNTTAAGRSNEITGSMTIDGNTVTDASFTVDVGSITSDESRRDNQFRGRIMDVDQFPEATFTLTEPIDFGAAPPAGEQITATATGDLTLRGVTNPVTFDVTAEAAEDRIGVLGNIPVEFADYEIPNPSTSGITTEDNGLLEFVLVFEPA